MGCRLPGSCPWNSPGSVIGVGCHSLPQGSSWPRDRTLVSCIAGRFFTIWVTREAHRSTNIWWGIQEHPMGKGSLFNKVLGYWRNTCRTRKLDPYLTALVKTNLKWIRDKYKTWYKETRRKNRWLRWERICLQWTLAYMSAFQFWLPRGISPVVGFLGHTVALFLVF